MYQSKDGDGLGMAPRPGEPETALEPGMAAPKGRDKAPRNATESTAGAPIGPAARSIPDTSIGAVALQEPGSWTYDFDPASGNSRASFNGVILQNGSPIGGGGGGVTSFNTRLGAVTLTSGDVAAVGVSSFNTRLGAVTLAAADLTAASPAPLNGVADGSNPAAGQIGEMLVAMDTGTAATLNISAGDWEISALVQMTGNVSAPVNTYIQLLINGAAVTLWGAGGTQVTQYIAASGNQAVLAIPSYRISSATAFTAQATNYTTGANRTGARLTATRLR